MFCSINAIKRNLETEVHDKKSAGFDVEGMDERLRSLPDSYDKLFEFAQELARVSLRSDWPYIEPSDFRDIKTEAEWNSPKSAPAPSEAVLREKARAAFMGSVVGCMLGKPVEAKLEMKELRKALEEAGEWPLDNYVTTKVLDNVGRRHRSWNETVRSRIQHVSPDDDINYTVLGMLVLEKSGMNFTRTDLAELWFLNLAPGWTFGPERTFLSKAATENTGWPDPGQDLSDQTIEQWGSVAQLGVELCGAAIRADAYGYAALSKPLLAAEMAFRDASMTHRRSGIYGTMFNAAAIASAATATDPIEIFASALTVVPRKSRFYEVVHDSLEIVDQASDWIEAYEKIHERHHDYGFCEILQETGTMINSAKFAQSTGHGVCLQVSQGNDTDSYGATLGSILGAYFGPEGLEDRWIKPFNNRIHTALSAFHETRLDAVAERMAGLPAICAQ